jgi:molybdenum-dependent DNA-binding transcriptional regulator ModE
MAGIISNEFTSLVKEFPEWPVHQTEMAIFQRLAERGSFAGAAEDVGLSPYAVAKLITRLEQRLGVRLINRPRHRGSSLSRSYPKRAGRRPGHR